MLTPREKIPSTGKKFSQEEYRTHDAASSKTASPNTTNELFRPVKVSSNTIALRAQVVDVCALHQSQARLTMDRSTSEKAVT